MKRKPSKLVRQLCNTSINAYGKAPTPLCAIVFEPLGGAVNRLPLDATAFHLRTGDFNLVAAARWTKPGDAESCIQWVRATTRAIDPFTIEGRYLNYLAPDEDPASSYSSVKQSKLASIKEKYDPTGFFKLELAERNASALQSSLHDAKRAT